jgi:hypothetical protein
MPGDVIILSVRASLSNNGQNDDSVTLRYSDDNGEHESNLENLSEEIAEGLFDYYAQWLRDQWDEDRIRPEPVPQPDPNPNPEVPERDDDENAWFISRFDSDLDFSAAFSLEAAEMSFSNALSVSSLSFNTAMSLDYFM